MYLAADIGGTKTVLAVCADRAVHFERRYASGDFDRFDDVLQQFFDDLHSQQTEHPCIAAACLGVAGVVRSQHVNVTNLPWELDAARLAERFDLGQVELLNDFVAGGYGVDLLADGDMVTLQQGEPQREATRLLIGAGTGMGVAQLLRIDGRTHVRASEGGHVGFAPADEIQGNLWARLHRELRRVELEHVVSGPGLERIYRFLFEARAGDMKIEPIALEGVDDGAEAIATAALEGSDPVAVAALDLFIVCYGAAAGDQALACLASGGVFIAGGIGAKLLQYLRKGPFIDAFNAKGDFSALVRSMPVHVIINERLGLLGAARRARELLDQGNQDDGSRYGSR